ncbi:MAG: SpoIIE family protein phosphatase [Ignavibacteriales bacterium]|nr:SpoIIE family protein phosphatase [Ignavibacteriales bacterium]
MKKLKTILLKYRQTITIFLAALVAFVALANLYFVFVVTVVSNDECLWIPKKMAKDSITIFFNSVKVNGVTWNAGVRNGDILLKIDNVKLPNALVAQVTLNKHKEGEYANYTIKKNGKIIETKVYIKKLINFGNLGIGLLGFIWLVVGFIVVMAKPDGKVQRLFYRIGCGFVLYMSIVLITNPWGDNPIVRYLPIVLTVDIIWSMAGFALPFMIVYFFWSFPKPFKIVEKKWLKKAFIISSATLFLLSYLYRWFFVFIPNDQLLYAYVIRITNILLGLGLLIGLISLFINFYRLKTKEEKKPLIVILAAYTLGVVALIYSTMVANIIADTIFNSPEYFMPIVLVAIIPISFGYSIFKYQLMDVSVVVKNTIVYGTATATIAVIYYLVTYGLGQGIGSAIGTPYQSAIAVFTFVIFAFIFQSTKDKFQNLLTRRFYPEQFTYQRVILKFSNDVVSIVGLENILDSMTETFISALRINRFGILLKENNSLKYELRRNLGLSINELTISDLNNQLANFIQEKLEINGRTYIEQSQFREIFPDNYEQLIQENIYTIVPMVIKSKVIGLLLFGLKLSGSQFAGKDLELLCAAANQAGLSLENARLYESEAKKLTMERDLDNARKIQEGLLPKQIPQITGIDLCGKMIPAMQVGGDYYDLIQISPTKLFVIVGDVSGKGLSASLYMSKLQTMVQLYCQNNISPKEVLVEINKRIYDSIERNWFITVNLALIDAETKTIKFCRAGHSPLLVINGAVKIYQSKGIGLGLEEGIIFEESLEQIELKYQPNEIYTFFSDGISEAMNEHNDLYGMDEFAEVIKMNKAKPVKEIMNEVMLSIEKFRGRREQNDDITIVLMKML